MKPQLVAVMLAGLGATALAEPAQDVTGIAPPPVALDVLAFARTVSTLVPAQIARIDTPARVVQGPTRVHSKDLARRHPGVLSERLIALGVPGGQIELVGDTAAFPVGDIVTALHDQARAFR